MPSYNLSIVGMGNVARALLRLLISKESDLRRRYDIRWRLTGVATLYDVVGSVKGHLGFTSREGSFFSSPIRIFSLSSSFIATKARCVNLAVDSGSTNHLFGLPYGAP